MNIETRIKLDRFQPREYQLPICDALENKGYKKILVILPRRAGKDVVSFNLTLRAALKKVGVYFYIFPTYSQARKVIWDSITNSGKKFLDYIPSELIAATNSQEMKITITNGSIIQLVGSDNFDCYDDKTEILTEDGWKLFSDLSKTERVATLKDGHLVYEFPTAYQEYKYKGLMYGIKNSGMDFLVTPRHRFFVYSGKGVSKFKTINSPTIKYYKIPSTCLWDGISSKYIMGFRADDWVAFLGIFLSEGSTFSNGTSGYRITISQIKIETRDEIESLLSRMGIRFNKDKNGFNFYSKVLYEYLNPLGLQPVRFIPKDIKELDVSLLKILFDWLVKGDGYSCKSYTAYYSTSRKLIDDVQEIIIKIGLSGNVYIRPQNQSKIRGRIVTPVHTLYEIRVRKSKFKRLHGAAGKDYIFKEYYAGSVFCVSVPSGVIKVRRNGKEIWSGNSLVGTNPQGVVFSEYALQDPRAYQFIRPILTANQGWALFISTPRGKNHMWELYQIAQHSHDWFCYKLTIEDTNHIPLSEILKEKEEGIMSDDLIQQEYYTSFTMGVEGSYYAKYMDRMRLKGQIGSVPWEPGFKVNTAWDIGVRDSTTIIFYQVVGQTVRIIDCYEKSKEGLEHYAKIISQKPYQYGKHFAPHDIAVKEWGSGQTRIEKAKQLGIIFTMASNIGVEDGIESVRSALSKVWIDEANCTSLIKALENYRQEYDAKKKVYKTVPLHDWSSHFADAMRYLCVSLSKTRDSTSPEELDRRYREAQFGSSYNLPSMFQDNQGY